MPDNKSNWHQLVVIGNGFDLACGLCSRFEDFYAPRRSELGLCGPAFPSGSTTAWCQDVINRHLTAWDIILQAHAGEKWCDIESAIADWVALDGDRLKRIAEHIVASIPEYEAFDEGVFNDYVEYLVTSYVSFTYGRSTRHYFSVSTLAEFLLSELRSIEDEFSKYLSAEVEKCSNYKIEANKLLFDLLADERPDISKNDVSYSVLSFNYTKPAAKFEAGGSMPGERAPVAYTNIHGRLGGEIVFGIDGKDYMGDPCVSPFTKTYRLLGLGAPDVGSVIRMGENGDGSTTKAIKFYGHSLGDADYSYFQALFDAVKLYESQTKLAFYYRVHGKKAKLNVSRK